VYLSALCSAVTRNRNGHDCPKVSRS
jgi:hypothetical protein